MQHPASLSDEDLLADCEVTRTRRGGPGGQHRNKVDSAIVLLHKETGVRAEANERRSQHENKAIAVERLRINLALTVRLEPESNPSQLWQNRCSKGRIRISTQHDDFPVLLAECLDVLTIFEFDFKEAAEFFSCSSSQLVKLLKQQPHAFELINRKRKERGLATLK